MTATLDRADTRGVLSRVFDRSTSLPPHQALLAIGGLLGVAWSLTYVTGGTSHAFAHAFYAPIVMTALPFRLRGSLLTALVAAVLAGPLMPLDSFSGTSQPVSTWITRAAMFAVVGAVVALTLESRRRAEDRRLADEHQHRFGAPRATPVEDPLVPLVADVLAERRFRTVYQPIYELSTGNLIAVEALTRFDTEPLRSPDLWFAAAHEAGLGTALELAAIVSAIEHARDLPTHVDLSINASPTTMGDPRLLEMLTRADRRITVEVTEHVSVADYDDFATTIALLRTTGARIAVDDAGAGVASLRHIVHIAPNVIKLDISLTQGVSDSPVRLALATSLIEFAQQTGAQLLVEGVEAADDLQAWARLGAHGVQGFLVGRPSSLPVPNTSPRIANQVAVALRAERRRQRRVMHS